MEQEKHFLMLCCISTHFTEYALVAFSNGVCCRDLSVMLGSLDAFITVFLVCFIYLESVCFQFHFVSSHLPFFFLSLGSLEQVPTIDEPELFVC